MTDSKWDFITHEGRAGLPILHQLTDKELLNMGVEDTDISNISREDIDDIELEEVEDDSEIGEKLAQLS